MHKERAQGSFQGLSELQTYLLDVFLSIRIDDWGLSIILESCVIFAIK